MLTNNKTPLQRLVGEKLSPYADKGAPIGCYQRDFSSLVVIEAAATFQTVAGKVSANGVITGTVDEARR